MPAVNVVEVNTFSANVQVPSTGDTADQSVWLEAAQPLANRTLYLKERMKGVSAGSIGCRVPMTGAYSATGSWTFLTLGNVRSVWQQSSVGAFQLYFPITHLLPSVGKIVGGSILLEGGTGHAALPAVVPTFSLVRWASDSGNPSFNTTGQTSIVSAGDPSGSAATYETVHSIILPAATEVIDLTKEYALMVTGESSTNALANQLTVGYVLFSVSA
jgi:hypothetical protein